MGVRLGSAVSTLRTIVHEIRRENIKIMAGSIAYHAFVSLLPILLLLMIVVSLVGDRTLATRVVELAGSYLPSSAQVFVRNATTNAANPGQSILGVVVLVWGTFKLFRALDAAFAEIYDTGEQRSLVGAVEDGVVVLVALGLGVVAMGVIGTAFVVPPEIPFDGALTGLLSVCVLLMAFLPMYYVFPNVDVSVSEILPGAVVAALGWKGLQAVFGVYVSVSSLSNAYGVVGTVLLVIIWLYFSGLLLLLGASVNVTLAGRKDPRRTAAEEPPLGRRETRRPRSDATTIDSERAFDGALERAITEARRNGVSPDELRRTLRKRAARVERTSERGNA